MEVPNDEFSADRPNRGWILAVGVGIILAAAAWLLMTAPQPKEPVFKFLRGTRAIKRERLSDPSSNYNGIVWTFHVPAEYLTLRREIFDELKPLGFSDAGGSGPAMDNPVRPVLTGSGEPLYRLFQSANSGVEIVSEEPATWVLGDRQTLWDPGSGTNLPGVVTVFVTLPDPGATPWRRWIQSFRRSLGL